MVRTAILSALTVAGLALPITAANAAPPVVLYPAPAVVYYTPPPPPPPPVYHSWTVRYRVCGTGPWHAYRTYDNAVLADITARNLQCRGFEVVIGVHG